MSVSASNTCRKVVGLQKRRSAVWQKGVDEVAGWTKWVAKTLYVDDLGIYNDANDEVIKQLSQFFTLNPTNQDRYLGMEITHKTPTRSIFHNYHIHRAPVYISSHP